MHVWIGLSSWVLFGLPRGSTDTDWPSQTAQLLIGYCQTGSTSTTVDAQADHGRSE
jgi:hypothetical protein